MKIKINRQNNNLKATYNKPKNTVAFRVISDCNRRGGNIHILFWLTPSRPNMKGNLGQEVKNLGQTINK